MKIKTIMKNVLLLLMAFVFFPPFYSFAEVTPYYPQGAPSLENSSASEMLGRGLICLPRDGNAYCSWRLLPPDEPNVGFDVYRGLSPDGTFEKVNTNPISDSTNYYDNTAVSGITYYYKVKTAGSEEFSNLFKVKAGVTTNFIDVPIFDNQTTIHSMVPADLDGDGMLDFVLKTPNWNYCHNVAPNTPTKISGMIFENGTWVHKWTVDTAGFMECATGQDFPNNPLLVWDLDGDLRAEVILRKGPLGKDLVILDGITGQERASMLWPEHEPLLLGDKDTDGAVIARLRDMNGDGIADPFIIIESGLYWGHQRFTSIYFNGTSLNLVDDFYSTKADYRAREGLGTHGLPIADIDLDGKDEIIPCGAAIDDDFNVMWEAYNPQRVNTRHNDTCFTADLRPDLPGLETFMGEEDNATAMGYAMMVDAKGHILWQKQADPVLEYDGWTNGWCAELRGDYAGTECLNIEKDEQREAFECGGVECLTTHVFAADGTDITNKLFSASTRGDASAERKSPVDWIKGEGTKEMYFYGNPTGRANSGWYHSIYGDLFGDSREEVVGFNAFLVSDGKGGYKKNNDGSYQISGAGYFRISSNIDDSTVNYRRVTPLADRNYRDALARVGVGYRTNYIPETAGQERTDVVYGVNPPGCASFVYSTEQCRPDGTQKRNIVTVSPSGCVGGSPVLSQPCQYIPPRPFNEVDPQGTYIDAENFTGTISAPNTGTFSVESSQPGFLGVGYLKTQKTPANSLITDGKEYLLNFPVAGKYKAWIRGFAPGDNSNSVSFGLDGVKTSDIMLNTYYDSSLWRWTTLKTPFEDSSLINVAMPGIHKLNIWANEANFIIDGIYLTILNPDGKKPTDLVHGKIVNPTGDINPADLNGDAKVDILDLQLCVNVILEIEKGSAIIQKAKAIAVPLDSCDVLDLQAIVNAILGQN